MNDDDDAIRLTRNCCAKRCRKDVLVARAAMGIVDRQAGLCGGRHRDGLRVSRCLAELRRGGHREVEGGRRKESE
jgi:hypothetical protein